MSKYLSGKYYQENKRRKRRIQKNGYERYQNVSKEEKNRQYGCERYKNISQYENYKLVG